MRVAVPVFPGSNCDHDALHACGTVMGWDTIPVWHQETTLPADTELVFVPAASAMATTCAAAPSRRWRPSWRTSGAMPTMAGLVLGVCNGFQILCEAQLLPGALLRNESLRFIHADIHLRVERADLPFTRAMKAGEVFQVPIAHAEGNFTLDPAELVDLEARGGVAFRYCSPEGGDRAHPRAQWRHERHRGHRERPGQRAGHDAPPGAGRGSEARGHRWAGHVQEPRRGLRWGLIGHHKTRVCEIFMSLGMIFLSSFPECLGRHLFLFLSHERS